VALCLVVAACGGSGNKAATTTTAPPTTLSAQQNMDQVAKVFTDFFNGANPDLDAKLALLDNPEKLRALYTKFANDPTTGPQLKGTSATVTKVVLNGDGTADVTYTLNLNVTPALMDQIGKAILQNGGWKVSGTTFCDLAALSDPANGQDPACA
jgi:hypothetical protein